MSKNESHGTYIIKSRKPNPFELHDVPFDKGFACPLRESLTRHETLRVIFIIYKERACNINGDGDIILSHPLQLLRLCEFSRVEDCTDILPYLLNFNIVKIL